MAKKRPQHRATRTTEPAQPSASRRRTSARKGAVTASTVASASALAATVVLGSSFIAVPAAYAAPISGEGSTTGDVVSETDSSQIIDVDAIASGQITDAGQLSSAQGSGEDVVSGRAQIATPRSGAQLSATYDGFEPLPAGHPVYFQWTDSDGAVSPIYSATTHDLPGAAGSGGPGTYAFAVPSWTDANGVVHEFQTRTDQTYRIFTDALTNPSTGNPLLQLRSAGGFLPFGFGIGSGDALGEFPGAAGTNGNLTRTGLWLYEAPGDYMVAADPVDTTQAYDPRKGQTISGTAFLEDGEENQLFKSASPNGLDATGYTIWATTLTTEGMAANEEIKELAPELRAAATKQMLEEHPEYIAGTTYATVDQDGHYTLQLPSEDFEGSLVGPPKTLENVYMWMENPAGEIVPRTARSPSLSSIHPC